MLSPAASSLVLPKETGKVINMAENSLVPKNLGGIHGVGEEAVIGEQIIKDVEAVTEKPPKLVEEKKTKVDGDTAKEDKPGLGNFFVSSDRIEWL